MALTFVRKYMGEHMSLTTVREGILVMSYCKKMCKRIKHVREARKHIRKGV